MLSELLIALGRAVAQAVSCRLPTAEAQIRIRVRLCEICEGQSDDRAGLSLSISISLANHSTDCLTHIIICHPGQVK
jgi:hypothetical protein